MVSLPSPYIRKKHVYQQSTMYVWPANIREKKGKTKRNTRIKRKKVRVNQKKEGKGVGC